jgi:hypothetical protein
MIDVLWQVTGFASIVAFAGLGIVLRRGVQQLDRRRDERRAR